MLIATWFAAMGFAFTVNANVFSVGTWLLILLLTHLYTGLFITAHDAIHGTVSRNKKVNLWIGRLCTTLFMFNSFTLLARKHHEHHKFAGTEKDPDFHPPHVVLWYLKFMKEYLSIRQIILAAITFNLLKLIVPTGSLLVFWILPSVLSTIQLFVFGTYLPHRGEHQNPHNARSQPNNHFLAFISCYFFGYHYEHHDSPQTPWWMLYKVKSEKLKTKS
ncbi:MAG: fatty acid desaturase [Sphingobacteriales bacterium]|nr:MAG: fatty acid desaturase [Sphingobacteriales bacterium]